MRARLGDRGRMRADERRPRPARPSARLRAAFAPNGGPERAAAFACEGRFAMTTPMTTAVTTPSTGVTWNPERVAQLRAFVGAGMTCSQIAAEIGVTRNAVIGKIHRLGLGPGRPAAAPGRVCPPRLRRPRLPSQRQLLRLISADAPLGRDVPTSEPGLVEHAQPCSLLDLEHGKCRWPVNERATDGKTADFIFCGNQVLPGFSYCAGHARMAYRSPERRRA
jgi:GcrA cell cycle regulator